jgi:hypothetical protein
MDDMTIPPSGASDDVTSELSHITEEIYKKNADLAQTNKTLSLLRHRCRQERLDPIRRYLCATTQIQRS